MHILNEKKYIVMKQVIDPELANFVFNYLVLKANVYKRMLKDGYFRNSKGKQIEASEWGTFNDKQVRGVFSSFGDIAMETLLMKVKPKMEEILDIELLPSYSYTRLYEKGAELKKHIDRKSCEVSTTLNLGGDAWPIFFKLEDEIRVDLEPGDMVLYLGEEIMHWREKFKGTICGQVFLHYNTKSKNNVIADGRPFVGLPQPYRNGEFGSNE
jgi:hypothetical protein|tara:strand:- start:3816 stop:4451 length:636 start_codon:yes stop_codon:yes gene_type:complete